MKTDVIILGPEYYDDWNRFVDLSPQGDVFCYSWWLDAVTKSKFSIYVIQENNEIVAGMPLAYDKHGKINEPFFTRTLGILFKYQGNISDRKRISNQRIWTTGLVKVISIKDFVQTCTHHTFYDWLPYKWRGLKQTTRYTYIIDYINNTEDVLWQKLNRGRKNVINRARRCGISVKESDDLQLLHNLVSMSYKRQGFDFRIAYNDLERLDQMIIINGRRLILVAQIDSIPIAAIYLAYNKKSSYYLVSGSDPAFQQTGGHTFLLWEAIKYFRTKVDYFNFGGSNIKRIEEHIKGFGGNLTPYFHIYNERQFNYLDIKYHIKSIFHHLRDILSAGSFKIFHR